jgi:hypothetical protein
MFSVDAMPAIASAGACASRNGKCRSPRVENY